MLAFAAIVLAGCAASPAADESGAGREAQARAEMLAAMSASAASWNAGDLKGHLSIYDDSVTVMTRTGPRPSIAAIEASFSAAYFKDGKPKQTLGFDQVSIRLLSPESALMTGRFSLTGGGLPQQSGWFSLVWLRTPAGWRVVHDHTS
ncbi:MAG TPA: nuclear transport factor 2 family protein [Casimicrobiaceae bacterium]|nr:nuclear transport factor 2 family protein [Casimicrobiaceae bacterium]